MTDQPFPILSTQGPWIQIKASERVMRSLAELNIFLGEAYAAAPHGVTVRKPAFDSFMIAKDAQVEEFAQFLGQHITTRGAFSYAQTALHHFVAGRYCSIANGLVVMGERHPLELSPHPV